MIPTARNQNTGWCSISRVNSVSTWQTRRVVAAAFGPRARKRPGELQLKLAETCAACQKTRPCIGAPAGRPIGMAVGAQP